MPTRLFQNEFQRSLQFFLLFFSGFFCVLFSSLSQAQQPSITSDGTLGTNVSINQSNYTISEGTIRGGNQFHSFGRFNVFEGESAAFTGPNSINNIIGRVTGGNESLINGLLRSEINGANLYLLNPSGVFFGPSARLDLSGSFHVSTADYLRLGENGVFYAALSDNSVLTVDPPSAFGFLSGNPAGVSIDGSWLTVSDGETLSVVGGDIKIEGGLLSGPSGQVNIASVASKGEVNSNISDGFMGIQLESFEKLGRIDLINGTFIDTSSNGAGNVVIRGGHLMINESFVLSNTSGTVDGCEVGIEINIRDDILANNAVLQSVTTGVGRSGDIKIKSANLEIAQSPDGLSSIIEASTSGSGYSGNIEFDIGGNLVIDKSVLLARAFGEGNSGDIAINSANLVMETSLINALTFGPGNSGDIRLTSDNLEVNSSLAEPSIEASTLASGNSGNIDINIVENFIMDQGQIRAVTRGAGHSGDIHIDSTKSEMKNGSLIDTFTDGLGESGNIKMTTSNLNLSDRSVIKTDTFGMKPGGDIKLVTGALNITNGAEISVHTSDSGDSGNLVVQADIVSLSNTNNFSERPASLSATTAEGSSGSGGGLRLMTDNLEIRDGASIDVSTFGSGPGGNLELIAENILLSGRDLSNELPAGIFARSQGDEGGEAGELSITTGTLEVLAGAQISTSTFGSGDAGNLSLTADHAVLTPVDASGVESGLTTGIFARGNIGDGGFIHLDIDKLDIRDGAEISSSSKLSGSGGDIQIETNRITLSGVNQSGGRAGILSQSNEEATGTSGDVRITTESLEIKDGAQISVAALGPGESGSLEINAKSVLVSGRRSDKSARINASTQTEAAGGKIVINSDLIEVNDGGLIQASTFDSGDGGTIDLTADQVIVSGISSDRTSRISAQSNSNSTGKSGDILIETGGLMVTDGGEISATSFGTGDGGSVIVDANSVLLSGGNHPEFGTGIFASSHVDGMAGGVQITTSSLEMTNSTQISVSTSGAGDGGIININAGRVQLSGEKDTSISTGLFSSTGSSGKGGNIKIKTDLLEVLNGAAISSVTQSKGAGGDIDINTKSLLVDGENSLGLRAGIAANATGREFGSGNAGNVSIIADMIQINNQGSVAASTFGPGAGGYVEVDTTQLEMASEGAISSSTQGTGHGGNIQIRANQFQLEDNALISAQSSGDGDAGNINIVSIDELVLKNSKISTEAQKSDGGNITINNHHMVVLLNGEISSSVNGGPDTVGGNISIDPEFVILQDSKIIANAFEGKGGSINIVTDVFLADSNSIIDASSDRGIDGTVDIRAAFSYLSENPAPMAEDFRSAVELLREPCLARMQGGKYNSLVVSGREAFPVGPGGLMPSPAFVK